MSYSFYNKNITLYDNPNYTVDITLEGVAFKAGFLWNERMKRYSFSLYKSDGTPLFEGVILNAGYHYPINNSNIIIQGLHGQFLLTPLDPSLSIVDDFYRNWADYFILTYYIIVPD